MIKKELSHVDGSIEKYRSSSPVCRFSEAIYAPALPTGTRGVIRVTLSSLFPQHARAIGGVYDNMVTSQVASNMIVKNLGDVRFSYAMQGLVTGDAGHVEKEFHICVV